MEEINSSELFETVEQQELREPSSIYTRNTQMPTFFGQPILRGTYFEREDEHVSSEVPRLYYRHPHGEIWCGDALAWLKTLESESVDLQRCAETLSQAIELSA